MAEQKKLSIQEFVESGLLMEANRRFFHPLGLALVAKSSAGCFTDPSAAPDRVFALDYIRDERDDPDGMVYGDLSEPARLEKGAEAARRIKERHQARHDALGFVIEPAPWDLPDVQTT